MLLLWFGGFSRREADKLQALTNMASVSVVQVCATSAALQAREGIVDPTGQLAAACGQQRWALIRPDSYLAAVGAQADTALLNRLAVSLAIA